MEKRISAYIVIKIKAIIRKWQQDDGAEDMENQVEKNIVNHYDVWNNLLLEQMLPLRLH